MTRSPNCQVRTPCQRLTDGLPIVISLGALVVSILAFRSSHHDSELRRFADATELMSTASRILWSDGRTPAFRPTSADLKKAAASLREAEILVGESAKTYYAWALYYYWSGEFDKSREHLHAAIARDSDHTLSTLFLSRLSRETGSPREHLNEVYQIVTADENNSPALIELVRIYLHLFRDSHSNDDRTLLVNAVQRMEHADAATFRSVIVTSEAYRALDRIDDAKKFATRASRMSPGSIEAVVAFAQAEAFVDGERATERLEQVMNDHPDWTGIYEILADLYMRDCARQSLDLLTEIAESRMHLTPTEIEHMWTAFRGVCN